MALKRKQRMLVNGVGFILPNIMGFLAFILIPLIASFVMAFTNWDVRLHNMFTGELPRFIWFENFIRLFTEPDFFKYLGHTLFFMMGIPLGIGGSLCAAILLTRDMRGGSRQVWIYVIGTFGLTAGVIMLLMAGLKTAPMFLLIGGVVSLILVTGSIGGKTVYRTLFYFPHFTAGVATYLLWKKIYNPYTGPLNNALRPLLTSIAGITNSVPAGIFRAGIWAAALLVTCAALFGVYRLVRSWREGDVGSIPLIIGSILLCLPCVLSPFWSSEPSAAWFPVTGAVLCAGYILYAVLKGREWTCMIDEGLGHGLIISGGLMVVQFAILGLGNVLFHLPSMSTEGLVPPEWLTNYHWAKPSLMIMGLWAAIGSNNMLLYIAGLSNIPPELYEAASIDGASGFQRFWHVTWPQLAPVTFFIVVMSVIGGLQGGFEMARTMTQGGPAGATTTLSYYIYVEGFETGRLGFASAVAWALFALVFSVTLFNWKFGNRYTNY